MAASKSQLASEQQMGDTTVAKSIFYIKFVALTHTLVWDQCGSVLVFAPVHPQHEGLSRSTAIAILLKTIKGHIESALQSQLRCFNRPEASVHNTFPGCPLLLKKKKKNRTQYPSASCPCCCCSDPKQPDLTVMCSRVSEYGSGCCSSEPPVFRPQLPLCHIL